MITLPSALGCTIRLSMFVAAAAMTGAVVAADPLAWKFNKGDVNHYRMTQATVMEMTMPGGQQQKTDMKQIIDMTWTVNEVKDDGSAVITQKMDRMRMDMVAGGQKMEYDSTSDKPAEGFAAMVAPLFKAMTSEAYKVTMTPRGEITEVDVPESLLKALSSAPGAQLMGDIGTKEGFQKLVSQASFVLPEKLEQGAEWERKIETSNPAFGKQTTVTTYKYEGSKEVDGKAMEAFSPSLEVKFEGGAGAAAKMDVSNQESSGEVLFNREAGRLELTNVKQSMDMTVEAAGQKMTQNIDQTIEMKWVPEGDATEKAE